MISHVYVLIFSDEISVDESSFYRILTIARIFQVGDFEIVDIQMGIDNRWRSAIGLRPNLSTGIYYITKNC